MQLDLFPQEHLLTPAALAHCTRPLQDFPTEESVTLLRRAWWLEEHLRGHERGKALVEDSRHAEEHAWQEYAGG